MTTRLTALRARLPPGSTLLVALLAGIAGVAGSFAVASFTPSFVAGPIAGAMARLMPGQVVTFAIVVLGDLGEQLNLLTAIGIAVFLLAGAALVGLAAGRRLDRPLAGPLVAAAAGTVGALAVTGAPAPSLAAGLAVGAVLAVAEVLSSSTMASEGLSPERRRILGALASMGVVAIAGYALGRRMEGTAAEASAVDFDLPLSTRAEIDALLAEADEKSLAVEGLEPLVSDEFYQVDINATDPDLAADEWTLRVTGAVEEEVEYTYDDIRAMAPENQFVTLRCVGEALNGRKMDNALWTGVPVMDLVDPAVPADTCCVMFRAADGFYEEFPLAALEDGFLAYGMNGAALPRGHGYPVRALIPGHWGEINVKWITEIEVLEEEQDGYWEKRGWHGTGPVTTVAKCHVIRALDGNRRLVAGHAYAGTRGIERVEVSTDGGQTWADADLSDPLPGTDVWRQWSYTYESPGEDHEVVVRATDGTGALQPRTEASAFPNGPSGWVTRTVRG